MSQPVEDDDTIELARPLPVTMEVPARRRRQIPYSAWAVPAVLLPVLAIGGWFLWPMPKASHDPSPPTATTEQAPPRAEALAPPVAAPPSPSPVPDPARAEPEPPPFKIETATEQRMLDHGSTEPAPDLTIFRLKANPRILVLDFASLRSQGRMLNRVAALIEKTGLPHDRLLSAPELESAVRASGDTVETFYYGHDYGVPSLVRFFALAERDKIALSDDEETLGRLIRQEGWFEPNVLNGLISIPQVGADEHVTRRARATILHHELSHGEYFTNPGYAAFVHRFWTQTLAPAERDRIRRHLQTLGYDSTLDDVMENEAQAYLMFTESADFFRPDMFGMTKGRVNELRNGFFRAMPAGWLRDSLGQSVGVNKTAAEARP